jgi:prepilin-type N-terminal cleavage/methylation domain-containing protein
VVLSRAFTLIELLVVIGIIAILASLVLAVIVKQKDRARETMAKVDVQRIVTGVQKYQGDYDGRMPVSKQAQAAALAKNEDFTYGTVGVANMPNAGDGGLGFVTPAGGREPIFASDAATGTALSYQANNSELIAILMDYETFPGTQTHTVNFGHVRNTQQNKILNASMSGDQISAGVGTDLVDRDPWGGPYIITLDLNGDGKTRDPFYRSPNVSADAANPAQGVNGLIKSAAGNFFEINQEVGVWSAGKDKQVDPNPSNLPSGKANLGANKNNITSWNQ